MLMGGRAECCACANTTARTPIGNRKTSNILCSASTEDPLNIIIIINNNPIYFRSHIGLINRYLGKYCVTIFNTELYWYQTNIGYRLLHQFFCHFIYIYLSQSQVTPQNQALVTSRKKTSC